MSSSTLRGLAVAVTVLVAVLCGAATGLLARQTTCRIETKPAVTAPPSAGTGVGGAADQPTVTQVCQTQHFAVTPAVTAVAGVLVVGAALLLLMLLSARRRTPAPVPAAGTARSVAGQTAAGVQLEADRKILVQACIYVRDRVTSKALGDRLGTALHDAGVTVLEPTGARFDPAHHEAGGAAPSSDPAKIGSIAAVEVPGYADRGGRILRAPVVTVYQAGRSTTQQIRREQPR